MSLRAHTLSIVRDAVVVALVAVLTVQGLRRWVGDRYLVPSDSMQPVLYGDPVDGDVVFVDKLVSAASRRRGDLVVVENPRLPGHQLVKRIAARGDDDDACWIDIRHGDVWLGPDPQRMQREVKEPRAAMARSVTWAVAAPGPDPARVLDLGAAGGVDGGGPWTLRPAFRTLVEARAALRPRAHRARFRDLDDGVLPAGAIGTRVPVDASYLDVTGRRGKNGRDVAVVDCGLELRFGTQPDVVLGSLDSDDFATTFVWSPRQDFVEVWLDGRKVREARDVLAAPWQGRLRFGRLDGRDFLLLDDRGEVVLATPGETTLPRPRTWLHVMTTGEADAGLGALRVFRDVFAWRQPSIGSGERTSWPRFVEAGHWFLLGDNAFDSDDSRYHGAFPDRLFLGVPSFVIGPWARARRLVR